MLSFGSSFVATVEIDFARFELFRYALAGDVTVDLTDRMFETTLNLLFDTEFCRLSITKNLLLSWIFKNQQNRYQNSQILYI